MLKTTERPGNSFPFYPLLHSQFSNFILKPINRFPELTPLVGFRRRTLKEGISVENDEPIIKIIPEEIKSQEKIEKTFHPAYRKSKEENSEEYHLLLCVDWVLSKYLEESHPSQDFISQFLATWGHEDKKNLRLFQSS